MSVSCRCRAQDSNEKERAQPSTTAAVATSLQHFLLKAHEKHLLIPVHNNITHTTGERGAARGKDDLLCVRASLRPATSALVQAEATTPTKQQQQHPLLALVPVSLAMGIGLLLLGPRDNPPLPFYEHVIIAHKQQQQPELQQ